VNRTQDDDIQANGKGVNVSLVLKMLGIENTALGFKAGFTGQYIDDFLRGKAIGTEFIDVPGLTRINVFTQVNDTQEEFKLVNKGPEIPEESVTQFLARVEQLQAGDFLCVSGSLPQGVAPTILIELAKRCQEREVFLIIDSSYNEVLACLPYQPFLLKPNEEELAAWFGVTIDTKEDYLHYGKKLVALGAQNVLLSLGGEGAYFFSKDALLYGNSPKGKVVNTACAGDTLLGTFLAGILKNDELSTTLKKSLAAGSSTAFRKGITDFSDVEELEKQIKISGE
jgi:1-phosphofructokinase